MDFSNLLKSVLAVADKVAPTIVPGAGPALAAGHAVIDLINHTKEIVGTHDQAALNDRLDALQARVNAHADRTIDSLG